MSYDKVQKAHKLRIGLKQTIKSIEQGEADEVIVAQDADSHVTTKVLHSCQKHNIPIFYVDSMQKLGRTCGIEVGAATVALKR